MSYGQNSVYQLIDEKLGVSLFRWSRRLTWALCQNCDCSTCPPHTKFAYKTPYNRVLTVAHIGYRVLGL